MGFVKHKIQGFVILMSQEAAVCYLAAKAAFFKGIFATGQNPVAKIPQYPRPLGRILDRKKAEVHYTKKMTDLHRTNFNLPKFCPVV
jgi:hypothetical protein